MPSWEPDKNLSIIEGVRIEPYIPVPGETFTIAVKRGATNTFTLQAEHDNTSAEQTRYKIRAEVPADWVDKLDAGEAIKLDIRGGRVMLIYRDEDANYLYRFEDDA